MRGIFIESLRGALVRLLRTFIMIVIILLIVFIIGLFHQEKVHALVYKDSVKLQLPNYNYNGYINSGNESSVTWTLNTIIQKNGYDSLQIRFNKFLFSTEADFDSGNSSHYICKEYKYNGSTNSYQCINWDSSSAYGPQTISNGTYYIRAISVNTDNINTPCYMTSEMEGSLICPINKDIKNIQFSIYQNGFSSFYYQYSISGVSAYWNNDSTEIVSGLTGVQQQQQNTTQAIQDLTTQQEQAQQYIENNNVTSSQTQFQGGVSDLSQQINAQISGVNDLTQIVLLPVTLFMDLSTGTCTPLHLVVPFTNNEIDLPCMKPIYEEHFNGLLTIFSTIVCAVTTYWVSVNSAKLIKEILDCDNDRIEVIDL